MKQYNSFVLRYPPPPQPDYGDNSEVIFAIGASIQGKRINVSKTDIATESGYDWVNLDVC